MPPSGSDVVYSTPATGRAEQGTNTADKGARVRAASPMPDQPRRDPLSRSCSQAVQQFGTEWRGSLRYKQRPSMAGTFVFCHTGGRYSAKQWSKARREPCSGAPSKNNAYSTRRNRLLDGKHPVSGAVVGAQVPCRWGLALNACAVALWLASSVTVYSLVALVFTC